LNGCRYELGSRAKAKVMADSLDYASGPVRQLEPLPPIPRVVPLVGNSRQIAAAVRVRAPRGSDIQGLYPRGGLAALPSPTKLSFNEVVGASSYLVQLEDENEREQLNLRTKSTNVVIPDGTLKAGNRYSWRVLAFGPAGVIAEGVAGFVTISGEDLQRRADFAKATEGTPDKALGLALRAEVDFRLGLLREAQDEFVAALRLNPNEMAIHHALDLVQSALAGVPGE